MKRKLIIALLYCAALISPQLINAQAKVGLNIGNKAPEIAEKTADGKELKLSSSYNFV